MMVEFIAGKVMACGGYDRTKVGDLNRCWTLDLDCGEWTILAGTMTYPVYKAASVAFRSRIMLFGGSFSNTVTNHRNIVQEYFVGNDTWLYRSDLDMPEAKGQHCAVNVDDDLIFVFGGYTTLSLDSAHVLNYTSHQWIELP